MHLSQRYNNTGDVLFHEFRFSTTEPFGNLLRIKEENGELWRMFLPTSLYAPYLTTHDDATTEEFWQFIERIPGFIERYEHRIINFTSQYCGDKRTNLHPDELIEIDASGKPTLGESTPYKIFYFCTQTPFSPREKIVLNNLISSQGATVPSIALSENRRTPLLSSDGRPVQQDEQRSLTCMRFVPLLTNLTDDEIWEQIRQQNGNSTYQLSISVVSKCFPDYFSDPDEFLQL